MEVIRKYYFYDMSKYAFSKHVSWFNEFQGIWEVFVFKTRYLNIQKNIQPKVTFQKLQRQLLWTVGGSELNWHERVAEDGVGRTPTKAYPRGNCRSADICISQIKNLVKSYIFFIKMAMIYFINHLFLRYGIFKI